MSCKTINECLRLVGGGEAEEGEGEGEGVAIGVENVVLVDSCLICLVCFGELVMFGGESVMFGESSVSEGLSSNLEIEHLGVVLGKGVMGEGELSEESVV